MEVIRTTIQDLWLKEPTRVVSFTAGLIIVVLRLAGVTGVDEATLGEFVGFVLAILLGGETIRSQVRPAKLNPLPVSAQAPVEDGNDQNVKGAHS